MLEILSWIPASIAMAIKDMYYYDITADKKKNYAITTPGVHVFYFTNKSGDLTFHVKNAKAKVHIFGAYDGTGAARFTLTTTQKHAAPGTESHVLIKGVFNDRARFDYKGLIHITKKASSVNATLENRNLVMSEDAHVQTKPALEISPADVTCTHAATVSYLNTEQTHFMQTRGITKKNAEKLLVDGFLAEMQQKIAALQ